jgi:predicted oxidoreductase
MPTRSSSLAAPAPWASSPLIFGTWRLLDDPSLREPAALARLLQAVYEAGITTIDTAEIYGLYQVEAALGQALRLVPDVKKAFRFVTKAGIYIPGAHAPECRTAHYEATADRLIASVEKSLRLLGLDTLDLFLIHRPDWFTHPEETARGLNQLIQQGKIRAAGVSNYTPSQFSALSAYLDQPLETNQVEYSLHHHQPMFDGTFDQCQEKNIIPMAWSPTGGGRLFDEKNPVTQRLRTAMNNLRSRYNGASDDQLAYAWIMAHPARPQVILGTAKIERVHSALRATQITLSREDWYALWEAAAGHPIP